MLKKRLIFGFTMAGAAGAVLYLDSYFAPYFPILAVFVVFAARVAVKEFLALVPVAHRPRRDLFLAGVTALLLTNFCQAAYAESWEHPVWAPANWQPLFSVFLTLVILAFFVEMQEYDASGENTPRVAYAALGFVYLGVLPAMFLKIRWLDAEYSKEMLTLAIFTPKFGDVGAYFAGRMFGKRQFAPRLSPKKTWAGFLGGMAASIFVPVLLHGLRPIFRDGFVEAVLFGVAIGFVGVMGDLAESLVKRDGQTKDAAASIPGFGGLLDVVDSILFAGPLAYLWFMLRNG